MTIILLISIAVLTVMLFVVLNALADEGIFFTKTKEGTAQAIMRGNTFVRMVMSWKGHILNEYGDVVEGVPAIPFLGWYWVGIWPFYKVYTYQFSWTEMGQSKDTGEIIKRPRSELTSYIPVDRFPYLLVETGLETKDENVPIDITVLVTVQVTNPYRALFRIDDYLQQVLGILSSAIRTYVGEKTYEEVLQDKKGVDAAETRSHGVLFEFLVRNLRQLKECRIEDGVIRFDDYGTVVVDVKMLSVDILEKLRNASTANFVAEQEGRAVRTTAEAEADAKRISAQAEADALKKVATAEALRIKRKAKAVQEMGTAGAQVLDAQKLEKVGEQGNTIVVGNGGDLITPAAAKLLKGEKE